MPRLWSETIDMHRATVREAALDAVAALVAERGVLSVTMSQIAEKTGIGRATLYKYFADVEALLLAWHERHVTRHLQHLAEVRDRAGEGQLAAVLAAYALILNQSQRHQGGELAVFLHRDKHVPHAQVQLHAMIRSLITAGVRAGELRDDVAPDELASYCLHAVAAAGGLSSKAAVDRLVAVTLAGLRPAR